MVHLRSRCPTVFESTVGKPLEHLMGRVGGGVGVKIDLTGKGKCDSGEGWEL